MNIVIVDDDRLVSQALKMILESHQGLTVSAMGQNGEEAVALYEKHQPDVLLMDIRMEPMNGLEASGRILQAFPDAKILLLTTFLDDEYIIKALNLGVKGYLLKQDYTHILPALEAVCSGQNVYGDQIMSKLPGLLNREPPANGMENWGLQQREQEIVELIAQGLNNKEIAARLFLSEGTVRNYLSGILEKLQLRDRTQIAVFYYRHRKI